VPSPPTLKTALNGWLDVIYRSKSRNTHKTYRSVARAFLTMVGNVPISKLSDSQYGTFLRWLKSSSPRTEKQKATVLALFYEYLAAKRIAPVNMDAIRYMRRNETRKVPRRLRKMDMPALSEIVQRVQSIKPQNIYTARAKAIVITLADTGLRAFEAASLKMSDIDRDSLQGIIIGKGDKERSFKVTRRMLKAIDDYHGMRRRKYKIVSEWIFLSHSKRHAKVVKPLDSRDTATIREDIRRIVLLTLERTPKWKITPHQFRHYLVTEVYKATHDIYAAKEAAGHESIETTTRYLHP
jgi:integrase/recombinase XerD